MQMGDLIFQLEMIKWKNKYKKESGNGINYADSGLNDTVTIGLIKPSIASSSRSIYSTIENKNCTLCQFKLIIDTRTEILCVRSAFCLQMSHQ